MDVSFSFVPDYPKLHVSLYTLNTASVWPVLRLYGKLMPQLRPHLSFYHWFCVHLPCCVQVQQTRAVHSYKTYKLMLPCRCEFFIDSKVIVASNFFQVIIFFLFHSHRCLKENPLGESRGKEVERIALSYSPLINRPQQPLF